MKIKDIVTLVTKSVSPLPEKTYHLYSLPSFDDGKRFELVKGSQIQSNKYRVPDKCILFNKLNVRFKRVWRINNLATNKLCSTEFLPLVIDESKVDFEYCYYLLISDSLTNYLCGQNSNTSGSHKRIEPSLFLNIDIILPDLSIQRRIGTLLSDIDKKIALNRQINDNLEAMARQLYDYWFVQFDFPDENGKPYKSRGGKMMWKEELRRNIPGNWTNGVLSDIANITMGQSPDGSSYNEDGKGSIFYQGSTDFGIRFPSIRKYTTAPSRFAQKGDILLSVRAPVGALNIANNDCCIGRGLASLSSKIGSTTLLYYILDDHRLKFETINSAGTTFGAITKDELYSLPIIVPSNEVIQNFEEVCKPIFDKQMIIGKEINSLTKKRDELLPLLINGQVTVNAD